MSATPPPADPRRKPTIADLRTWKGRRQLTMLRYFTLDEAAAAEAAGIDIASVPADLLLHPTYRDAAPTVFSMTGQTHTQMGTIDDYQRWCGHVLERGADAVYTNASLKVVERLAENFFPVVGHVGLVPTRASWTGGFRAVGKTAASALQIYREVKDLENAGAFAAEIEVVPAEVAEAIASRTGLLLWSMGAGAGCDAQYLFANDVLGYTEGHIPRHAKVYRDFAAEYRRLQAERVAAFSEFASDVRSGAFPGPGHLVTMEEAERIEFLNALERF